MKTHSVLTLPEESDCVLNFSVPVHEIVPTLHAFLERTILFRIGKRRD